MATATKLAAPGAVTRLPAFRLAVAVRLAVVATSTAAAALYRTTP
jgi:hypothetical protein